MGAIFDCPEALLDNLLKRADLKPHCLQLRPIGNRLAYPQPPQLLHRKIPHPPIIPQFSIIINNLFLQPRPELPMLFDIGNTTQVPIMKNDDLIVAGEMDIQFYEI